MGHARIRCDARKTQGDQQLFSSKPYRLLRQIGFRGYPVMRYVDHGAHVYIYIHMYITYYIYIHIYNARTYTYTVPVRREHACSRRAPTRLVHMAHVYTHVHTHTRARARAHAHAHAHTHDGRACDTRVRPS